MITRVYSCRCDKCHAHYIVNCFTKGDSIKFLVKNGWKYKNKKLHCDKCSLNLKNMEVKNEKTI